MNSEAAHKIIRFYLPDMGAAGNRLLHYGDFFCRRTFKISVNGPTGWRLWGRDRH